MPEPERELPPGYEFIRVLGSGGFGEVVLAEHLRLHRQVAVKRIHDYALADPEAVERFRREARVLAATECPEVVKIYDLSQVGNVAQIVMEYVPGQPLAEILESGPLPGREALVVLRDVASALAFAAARGVVHRDVKPGNVFVLPSGRAKLGDFGLARIAADPSLFRTTGAPAMGTPAYFPPEVSQGVAEPDVRSDAYSFAVMAYETLTGHLPFRGDDIVSLITAHWTQSPPDPASVMPGFPASASVALLSGLDKTPAKRLLPAQLVQALERVPAQSWPTVAARPVAAKGLGRPSDPTVRGHLGPDVSTPRPAAAPMRPTRRHRRVAVLSAAVIAGVAAVAVGYAVLRPSAPALQVLRVTLQPEPATGRAQCPNGKFTFTADILTNGRRGVVEYRWTRPDGQTTQTHEVPVDSGERHVLARLVYSVTGTKPLDGEATIDILQPSSEGAKQVVHYECSAP
jgi:serine/threonine-protein kinase